MRGKRFLVLLGFLLISLAMVGIGPRAHAWVGSQPMIMFENIEGRRTTNGLFMVLDLITTDPAQAEDVKSIRAWNTDPGIDPAIYTDWLQFNEVRKTQTIYQFIIEAEYTGQYGAYDIEVTYQDDSTEILTTPVINQWTDPFATPSGLEVDYSTGITTPTFRFMPVDDPDIDHYQLRLRCYEGPDQARMIYRTTTITEWTPGQPVEVAYPQESDGQGTEEPLAAGIEYHVRVEAYDMDGASSPPTWQASFRSDNRLYFYLPTGASFNLADYYPLTQGSTWTYRTTENGTEDWTEVIAGFEKVRGIKTAKVWEGGEGEGAYRCEVFDLEGAKEYKWYQPSVGLYGIYDPPDNELPAQMYVAQTHVNEYTEKIYNLSGQLLGKVPGTVSVTLQGLEAVSVPAGDFSDCLKLYYYGSGELMGVIPGWKSWIDEGTYWLANGVGRVKEIWIERIYNDQGQLVEEWSGTNELISYGGPTDNTLTRPNGGNVIPSGSTYPIQWTSFPGAASYKLMYSMNNGRTWKLIAKNVAGNDFGWPVPTPTKNKTKCLVKVIGYDDSGAKVGVDRSDWTSTLEVVKVISPDGGEILTSGSTYTITWQTNETKKPVEKVILKYTKNGGRTWEKITTIKGNNPGTFSWTVPDVPKTKSKCKVKVVSKALSGKTVGSDTSDGYFTIEP